jgi:hypothetical protein
MPNETPKPQPPDLEEKLELETLKCIGQIAVSLVLLGVGLGYAVFVPGSRDWSCSMIALVAGYWLR